MIKREIRAGINACRQDVVHVNILGAVAYSVEEDTNEKVVPLEVSRKEVAEKVVLAA
ncbi:MAG: hypothetical protein POH28_03380 [Acidocella sp.]|nr:hypothetical protein [Acidocella sp.]